MRGKARTDDSGDERGIWDSLKGEEKIKCPNCNEEIEIMCETTVGNNTLEVIGMCENCLYDGTWFIEKDEKGNVIKEYGLKQYWHG